MDKLTKFLKNTLFCLQKVEKKMFSIRRGCQKQNLPLLIENVERLYNLTQIKDKIALLPFLILHIGKESKKINK